MCANLSVCIHNIVQYHYQILCYVVKVHIFDNTHFPLPSLLLLAALTSGKFFIYLICMTEYVEVNILQMDLHSYQKIPVETHRHRFIFDSVPPTLCSPMEILTMVPNANSSTAENRLMNARFKIRCQQWLLQHLNRIVCPHNQQCLGNWSGVLPQVSTLTQKTSQALKVELQLLPATGIVIIVRINVQSSAESRQDHRI